MTAKTRPNRGILGCLLVFLRSLRYDLHLNNEQRTHP